jgi:hypothetical protein
LRYYFGLSLGNLLDFAGENTLRFQRRRVRRSEKERFERSQIELAKSEAVTQEA